jgi:2'-5' RNA ligase
MTTLRSFIAIELSYEATTALAELQKELKIAAPPGSVRWTAPDSIHLTLHFLGDVEVAQVDAIAGLLQSCAAAYPPLSLRLAGLGCFPNMRRPRIVWVGVTGETAPLISLQRDLGEKLQVIGYTPEDRPYAPHLTIGRVKKELPGRQLVELGQALAQIEVGQLAQLDASGISLMKSDLQPAGPVYSQLAFAPLGK